MKKLKRICAVAAAAFALLQFTNPALTNPPVTDDFLAATSPPANLSWLIRSACYDCHSHETRWPWYSHAAPISWVIASDVNHARAHLALSLWPTNDNECATKELESMSEEIRSGEMPPRKYGLLHPEARLTTGQRGELADWLATQASKTVLSGTHIVTDSPTTADSVDSPGRILFLKNCALCHGADASGDEGPDLHKLDWTDEQIIMRIMNGKKDQMTAFAGKLTVDQIREVKDYLRTLK